jgi:hypothetical protein
MIATFNRAEDAITVDSRRELQFMTPTFVGIGYQLRALIRAGSCKIQRHFAAFADVPFHDPLSRQRWEQLWESQCASSQSFHVVVCRRTVAHLWRR